MRPEKKGWGDRSRKGRQVFCFFSIIWIIFGKIIFTVFQEEVRIMEKREGFFSHVKGDFFGGITAGVVALPLALAFGEQTELGAVAGLYGAIALGVIAALLGGTKTQISGPTAPMTVVSAVMITEAVGAVGSLQAAMPFIVAVFVMTGALQVLLGVLKLGKYIKYIPYPVVSGFMSGIGVIIVVTQIFPFVGAVVPGGEPSAP